MDLLVCPGEHHRSGLGAHCDAFTTATATGCTLSSAIAARLGAGPDLRLPCGGAWTSWRHAAGAMVHIGRGHGAEYGYAGWRRYPEFWPEYLVALVAIK